MQHDAWAMQQLPLLMQQSELFDATFDVALAVLISAATATIIKYFMCSPVGVWLFSVRTKCGPGATNEWLIAAAERAAGRPARRWTE